MTRNLEKFVAGKRHIRVALFGTARTQEREGQRRTGRAKEEELRKVRYKPEELGLYIDDLHAPLKPELQRTPR